ncbi:hypothetical protein [Salarchaeum japonicum]|uniref:Uncharacterized protein n=1 Tax=Salarchaeum japonicum TaxID=555573 RepID=A0AAV3SZY7_9EURY|nr:hypothetical protein [Salarchaeum japonicum]
MAEHDIEIPDWIESRIDSPNNERSLTQRGVVKEFLRDARPFYSITRLQAEIKKEVSKDTVRSRAGELHERGVLGHEEINNGDVYWLKHPKSEWPIPPDVEVEPKRNKLTVEEWQKRPYVRFAAGSVFLAIIGTAVTLVGTFQTTGAYQLPFSASNLIAAGLSAGIISYIGLFVSGLVWLLPESVDYERF